MSEHNFYTSMTVNTTGRTFQYDWPLTMNVTACGYCPSCGSRSGPLVADATWKRTVMGLENVFQGGLPEDISTIYSRKEEVEEEEEEEEEEDQRQRG